MLKFWLKTLCCFGKKCLIIIANKVMCAVLKKTTIYIAFFIKFKNIREKIVNCLGMRMRKTVFKEKRKGKWKEIQKKRGDIHIADSLCCTVENNTTL